MVYVHSNRKPGLTFGCHLVISNKDNAPASAHTVILTGGQIGALLGTFLLKNQAINLGISMLSYVAAIALLFVPLVIRCVLSNMPILGLAKKKYHKEN